MQPAWGCRAARMQVSSPHAATGCSAAPCSLRGPPLGPPGPQSRKPPPPGLCPRSYSAGYPSRPLQLRLLDPEGLLPEDLEALSAALADSAASYARQDAVCVFNLVDDCQECLRAHNAGAAARAEEARVAAEAAAAAAEGEVRRGRVRQGLGARPGWHAGQGRQACAGSADAKCEVARALIPAAPIACALRAAQGVRQRRAAAVPVA